MIKNERGYNDIYNYRNSRYFIETIKKARRWDKERKLVIFAGACQSYFEALISAGANFASSPARILIDFADPLIVAENVATTDSHKYITIDDFAYELRDGKRGIDGVRCERKKTNNICITVVLQKCNIIVTLNCASAKCLENRRLEENYNKGFVLTFFAHDDIICSSKRRG